MPALVAALMIAREPGIPYMDEWEWADLSAALHHGTLHFGQLWAMHNEHRILVPNLLFTVLDRLIGWRPLLEELAGLAIVVIGGFALFRLVRRTETGTRGAMLFFAASLLLYTPVQFENFSMGFNVGWAICTTALIVVVERLTARPVTTGSVTLALSAALIASVSSAQGLVVLLVGAALLAGAGERMRLFVWAIAAVLAAASYVFDVHDAAGHVALTPQFWPQLGAYAAILLGLPFGFADQRLCALFGTAGVMLFFVLAVRRGRGASAWIAFGAYALLCAAFIAPSRLGFGLDTAMASHYAAIAIFLYIAILGLFLTERTVFRIAPAVAAGVIGLLGYAHAAGAANEAWHGLVRDHVAAAALIRHDDWSASGRLYPDRVRLEILVREACAVGDSPIGCPNR